MSLWFSERKLKARKISIFSHSVHKVLHKPLIGLNMFGRRLESVIYDTLLQRKCFRKKFQVYGNPRSRITSQVFLKKQADRLPGHSGD